VKFEDQQRFEVWAAPEDAATWIAFGCNRCALVVDLGSEPLTLAELNQRADEHAEVCP
jgi:hypothetical protein